MLPNNNNLISIIIPVFNRENVLKATLESVLQQTYNNWECILVDDNSTDNSTNVIMDFINLDSRFSLYLRSETSKPKGVSSCRNIGLDKAKGKYVIFLDSDDLLIETCLENRLNFSKKNNDADVWVFKMQEFNEKELKKICNHYPNNIEDEKQYLKMILRYKIPFSVTCPLWKLTDLKGLEGFDENFNRLEDPDLHCRAFIKGLKFKFDINSKSDCLYRVDEAYNKRFKDPDFMLVFFESFYKFIKKYIYLENTYISFEEIRIELNLLTLRVFKEYIFTDTVNTYQFKMFYKLGKNTKILTKKELIYLKLMKFYLSLNLNNISGLGYHRIRNKVFIKLNPRNVK